MGFSKPPGVPCPPSNPHCHGDVPSASIDNPVFIQIMIIVAVLLILYIILRHERKKG